MTDPTILPLHDKLSGIYPRAFLWASIFVVVVLVVFAGLESLRKPERPPADAARPDKEPNPAPLKGVLVASRIIYLVGCGWLGAVLCEDLSFFYGDILPTRMTIPLGVVFGIWTGAVSLHLLLNVARSHMGKPKEPVQFIRTS